MRPSIEVTPLRLGRYRVRVDWPPDESYDGFRYEDVRFGARRARRLGELAARLPWCRPMRVSALPNHEGLRA